MIRQGWFAEEVYPIGGAPTNFLVPTDVLLDHLAKHLKISK